MFSRPNLRSPNYRGCKSELCVLGIEKRPLTHANPQNAGGFQLWRVTQSLPLATSAGWILYTVTELVVNACSGQVDFLKGQVKEENVTCLTGQLIWLKHLIAPKFRREWFWFDYIRCKRRLIMNNQLMQPVYVRESRGEIKTYECNYTQKKHKNVT